MKVELQIDESYKEKRIVIQSNVMDEEIKNILEKINPKKDLIKVSLDDDTYLIKEDEIESVYTENSKVFVRTKEKVFVSRKRLYEFEEILSKDKFARISNSEIVNFDEVKNFNTNFLNTICINFYSGNKAYVSRRYVKKIKEFLDL